MGLTRIAQMVSSSERENPGSDSEDHDKSRLGESASGDPGGLSNGGQVN